MTLSGNPYGLLPAIIGPTVSKPPAYGSTGCITVLQPTTLYYAYLVLKLVNSGVMDNLAVVVGLAPPPAIPLPAQLVTKYPLLPASAVMSNVVWILNLTYPSYVPPLDFLLYNFFLYAFFLYVLFFIRLLYFMF